MTILHTVGIAVTWRLVWKVWEIGGGGGSLIVNN